MSMPVWYTFIGFLHFILHCNCNTIKNHFSVTDNPCNLGIHWFYFCVLGLVVLATEFYSNIFLGVAWRPTNAKQFIFRLSTLIHIDTTGTNAFTVNEIEMIRENCLLCEINSCRFVVGLTRLAEANERQKKTRQIRVENGMRRWTEWVGKTIQYDRDRNRWMRSFLLSRETKNIFSIPIRSARKKWRKGREQEKRWEEPEMKDSEKKKGRVKDSASRSRLHPMTLHDLIYIQLSNAFRGIEAVNRITHLKSEQINFVTW